jgi:hypothetical protein
MLVVRQSPEIVDSTAVYAISGQDGARVGAVVDVGRRDLSTALRPDQLGRQAAPGIASQAGGFMGAFKAMSSAFRQVPYRLEVRNEVRVPLLVLTSAEWDERSLITVARGDGVTVGTIALQSRLLRKPRYALEAGGERVGTIVADKWWTVHHHVLDKRERKVARIAPRRLGWLARTLAHEPESFAVHISLPLPDPLHSLLLAGALAADTALKRQPPPETSSV